MNVRIGIIAVPKAAAQQVADELAEGGVRAIWNFAPVHLNAARKHSSQKRGHGGIARDPVQAPRGNFKQRKII